MASLYRQFGAPAAQPANERPGYGTSGLIGSSPGMQKMYALIQRVSQFNFPVLILGESGTGKELVARAIHSLSPRHSQPFVPVDCAALVPTLMESELFGYVKGAFTGAIENRRGLVDIGKGGTLFLDEIGELPVQTQTKLLRALQEREIRPIGATNRIRTDVRIIAATNRDLEEAMNSRTFRQDLYFRLNVVEIKIPPLRNRKRDIPLLTEHFLDKFSHERLITSISEDAMRCLVKYDWPGNVRELENKSNARLGRPSTWGPPFFCPGCGEFLQLTSSNASHSVLGETTETCLPHMPQWWFQGHEVPAWLLFCSWNCADPTEPSRIQTSCSPSQVSRIARSLASIPPNAIPIPSEAEA